MKYIYRPPPPPFIGGSGPLLPRRLPPSELAVPVNDPPFSRLRGIATLAVIIGIWQPSLLGLPQSTRFVVQPGPVVADNPPFTSRTVLPTILATWEPPPPKPQVTKKLPPSVIAVPENNPPFSSRTNLPTILASWQPRVPYSIRQRHLVPIEVAVVNDPPFGQRIWLSTILRAWEPAPPLPWLVSYFTEEGVAPVGQNVPGTRYRRRHRSRTIYS